MSACLALLSLSGCKKDDDDSDESQHGNPVETGGTASNPGGSSGHAGDGPGRNGSLSGVGGAGVGGSGGEGGLSAQGSKGIAADTVSGLGEVEVEDADLSPGDPSTGANLGTAMCDAEETVLGGGCDCNGETLIGSRMEDKGWSCACVAGEAQKAYAVCAGESIKVSSVSVAFPGHSNQDATVECPAGTQLISVGVHCGFTGPNGPKGPTGNHGHPKTVMPNDSTHVAGHCGSTRVGGGVEATLYGYCIANAVANLQIVQAPSSSTSLCGDGTTVVGGGCQCHDIDRGPLQAAYIDGNGFACSCKNHTANETIAVCATQ